MDKILSARVDEAIIRRIGALALQLGTTKKAIIENAVRSFAQKIEEENDMDVLEQTFGAWDRKESPQTTVENARKAFRDSMRRYHE